MFYFAECYWEGLLGLQIDHERAFNLYQSAAKLNHAPSAYRTAGTIDICFFFSPSCIILLLPT